MGFKALSIPSLKIMKQCWTCKYQQKGGMNLFGSCLYWEELGEKKKEIPVNIVDVGCKYYRLKV